MDVNAVANLAGTILSALSAAEAFRNAAADFEWEGIRADQLIDAADAADAAVTGLVAGLVADATRDAADRDAAALEAMRDAEDAAAETAERAHPIG
jgi:uncharacterized protein CbrC (UPF0167 family)